MSTTAIRKAQAANAQMSDGVGGLTIVASAARTVSADIGDTRLSNMRNARAVLFVLDVTAQSGTAPTLDVAVVAKIDNSYTLLARFSQYAATTGKKAIKMYRDTTQAAELVLDTLANVAATGGFAAGVTEWDDILVVKWAIAGTTPSFTFSVKAYPIY